MDRNTLYLILLLLSVACIYLLYQNYTLKSYLYKHINMLNTKIDKLEHKEDNLPKDTSVSDTSNKSNNEESNELLNEYTDYKNEFNEQYLSQELKDQIDRLSEDMTVSEQNEEPLIKESNNDNKNNDKNNPKDNDNVEVEVIYTPEHLNSLTVKELQTIAKNNNLIVKGKKTDLVDRILKNKNIPELPNNKESTVESNEVPLESDNAPSEELNESASLANN